MKRRSSFHFLGFIALADMLFAVSAGLLLLNPIRIVESPASPPQKPEPNRAQTDAVSLEMRDIETNLNRIEADGEQVRQRAQDLVKQGRL